MMGITLQTRRTFEMRATRKECLVSVDPADYKRLQIQVSSLSLGAFLRTFDTLSHGRPFVIVAMVSAWNEISQFAMMSKGIPLRYAGDLVINPSTLLT